MKKIIAVLGFVLVSSAANASSDMTSSYSTSSISNNTAGHFSITGDIAAGFDSIENGVMSVNPQVEYFVMDKVSLGVATNLMTSYSDGADSQYGISAGPSATWHFWNMEQVSTYGGANWMFNNLVSSSQASFSDRLTHDLGFTIGANYNFVSWFGMGPKVKWNVSNVTNEARNSALSADIGLYFYL